VKASYSKVDIVSALRDCEVREGDAVYVSSSLGMVGIPEPLIDSEEKLCKLFFDAIFDVIGPNGTLYVPTFTYTFGQSTKSTLAKFTCKDISKVGPFTNYVLSLENSKRSKDPMLSITCIGHDKYDLLKASRKTSYGEGSSLEKLATSKIKLLNIGIGPNWMPFIHYLDHLNDAPYRYKKEFFGEIADEEGGVYFENWEYHVPVRVDEALAYADRVGYAALEDGLYKSSPLGRTKIYSIEAQVYFNFAKEMSKHDAWTLAKGPRCNLIEEEANRANLSSAYRIRSGKIGVNSRAPEECISDLVFCDFTLDYLIVCDIFKSQFNVKQHKFSTGTLCNGVLVPELWFCSSVCLTIGKERLTDESIVIPFSKSISTLEQEATKTGLSKVLKSQELCKNLTFSTVNDIAVRVDEQLKEKLKSETASLDLHTHFLYSKLPILTINENSSNKTIFVFCDSGDRESNFKQYLKLKQLIEDGFDACFAIVPSYRYVNLIPKALEKRVVYLYDFI